tara:strand:- start:22209 stop:23615 length:1407 start_codon:yes stop_codon:yes gene_type:complete
MHFKIRNTYTEIEGTETEIQKAKDMFTFQYPYWQRGKGKRPELKFRMLCYLKYNRFPTGWIRRIMNEGFDNTFEDLRKPVGRKLAFPHNLPKLRPEYQTPAVQLAINSERGIIHHCTGAGKTVIMAHLIHALPHPTLILVPSLNLLNQNYKEMCKFFSKDVVGIIGEGKWEPNYITISTVQTLWSHMKKESEDLKKFFKQIDMLLIEEAHHINTGSYTLQNSYFKICMHLNARYRFGLTATPGDEKSIERDLLEGVTGRVIHEVKSSQLIKWGYLTQPKIKMINCFMNPIHDWKLAYDKNILENKDRNKKIVDAARVYANQGKSVLITVTRVKKHGRVLLEALPESRFMSGSTTGVEREKILDDFKNKKFNILISTVVNEGVNIPAMDVIILAGGGRSDKMTIQRVGRVLRKSEGKNEAVIIDFFDKDRSILQKHSQTRLRLYKKEEQYKIELNSEVLNNEPKQETLF